jgi:heme-degrading monooxygenase HmoA
VRDRGLASTHTVLTSRSSIAAWTATSTADDQPGGVTTVARPVRFSFGEGRHADAQALADDIVPLIALQPGCEGGTVFGDDPGDQYGIFVLWDTQSQAVAASVVVRPRSEAHVSGKVTSAPELRLFEVIST